MPPSVMGDQILLIVPENKRLSPRLTDAVSIAVEEFTASAASERTQRPEVGRIHYYVNRRTIKHIFFPPVIGNEWETGIPLSHHLT